MIGYSSRFIQDYDTITAPLRELTHKHNSWNWTEKHQKAIDTLKEKLQSAPALAYFDMAKPTQLIVSLLGLERFSHRAMTTEILML